MGGSGLKLHDISMRLKQGMIVYPGNPEFNIKQLKSIPADSSNLSEVRMGVHTGTHVDSPLHVNNKGVSVDELPLNYFYGKCLVIDLTNVKFGEGLRSDDFKRASIKQGDIILLKTRNSGTGFKAFKKDFVYLTEDGAQYLVDRGVKTVGIDYLSIQKYHTGYCASHCVLLDNGLVIFEGLDLSQVKEGRYTFIGLPLRIIGAEGAPARAVLIED
ncbi:cyclase family protein [archaeon]|nr:cyclase family protein [archaeon]